MNQPRVTFGIVNCNRLFYLKSCFESLLRSTESYANKEIIVVDNAPVESGTKEYLSEINKIHNVSVICYNDRDPANEFARALNTIVDVSFGEYIVPLQGDMQFVLDGPWLDYYVKFAQKYSKFETVGCITLDAQREVTNKSHAYAIDTADLNDEESYRFVFDLTRDPVAGAADVFYPRSVLEKIGPWSVNNKKHEGGYDSETAMLQSVKRIISEEAIPWHAVMPIIPPAIAINTDSRGTNARVRKNRRYGDYWPPKEDDFRYYEFLNMSDLIEMSKGRQVPMSIEEMVKPVGFDKFVDKDGNWLKNPIRPETAQPEDFVELDTLKATIKELKENKEIEKWLKS